MFFMNSILLGVGLAMDAFSVSLANGLNEPKMKQRKMFVIAGVFAIFQAIMPLIGWFCVHNMVKYFKMFEPFIPWIALILLCYIGGKMFIEAVKGEEEEVEAQGLGLKVLMIQGIATSIDALSVGFTIVDYEAWMAMICAGIIGLVTFVICYCGVHLGKRFGMRFSKSASMFGGIILIAIGLEIFVSSFL